VARSVRGFKQVCQNCGGTCGRGVSFHLVSRVACPRADSLPVRKFINSTTVLTCTLLGRLSLHALPESAANGSFEVNTLWTSQAPAELTKINAIAVMDADIALGGLDRDGRGVVCVVPRQCLGRSGS
jgi:hypothetical protein